MTMTRKQYRQLACSDTGPGCDFLVRAETDDEVLEVLKGHATRMHGYTEFPPEAEAQIRSLIKTVEV
jgi:predicted small metal-binding protein